MKKILGTILSILLCACSVDEIKENTTENQIEEDGKKVLQILKEEGFNTHNAIIDDEFVVIEGDISMNIAYILENHKEVKPQLRAKQALYRKHTFYGGRVSNEYNNRVKFSMTSNMRGQWLSALNIAIARYNEVNECRVQMSYTTGSSHSHISYKNLSGNFLAKAELPQRTIHSNLRTYRKPGTHIHVDPMRTANFTLSQKVALLMHEMGHNMGFEHVFDNAAHKTNYINNIAGFDGTQIQGTALYDRYSVMNATGLASQGVFTTNDEIALKQVYPGPFVSDFNQTITGPQYGFVGEPISYSTSANNSSNSFLWQVKYAGSQSWINILNGRNASVTFNIGSQATPNGNNNMEVRCTVIRPNGDESRKSFFTMVEGNPTDGSDPR